MIDFVEDNPTIDFAPDAPKVDFEPDLPAEGISLMDFIREQPASLVESSPMTPEPVLTDPAILPTASEGTQTDFPDPMSLSEVMSPGADPVMRLGEQPAEVPSFGEEGTLTRGFSDVIKGIGEWALNKPEEALASMTFLGPAVLARYGPEVAKHFATDWVEGLKGDNQALGRALTMTAMVGGPAALKKIKEERLVKGDPGTEITPPAEIAERAQFPGKEGVELREGMVGVKANIKEPILELPVKAEEVLPSATETLKAIEKAPEQPKISPEQPAAESEVTSTAALNTEPVQPAAGKVEPAAAPTPKSGSAELPKVEPPDTATAAATPAEAPTPSLTGIKNASVDAQRAARGLEPILGPMRKSDEALFDQAMKMVEEEPGIADRLTKELTEKPRPMTDVETVILERRMVEIRNELDLARTEGNRSGDLAEAARERARRATTDEGRLVAAAEEQAAFGRAAHYEGEAGKLSDVLSAVEQAVGRETIPGGPGAGTLMGRAFRARRIMMREDFSYAGLEAKKRAANGFRKLTQQELDSIRKTADEWKVKNDALEQRVAEQTEIAAKSMAQKELAELRAAEAQSQAAMSGRVKTIVLKVGQVLDKRADLARQRLRGKVLSLSPADLKDIAEIAASNLYHIGENVGRWSAKMVEEFGEKIKPHLDQLWKDAQRLRDEIISGEVGPTKPRKSKSAKPTDAEAVQEAIRQRIRNRIAAYEERIKAGDYSSWRKPPKKEMDKTTLRLSFELDQIKKQFHEQLIQDKMNRRSKPEKIFGGAVESVNAMRAVLTSADLSAVLRQGLFIGLAHPIRAGKSIVPMIRAMFSEEKAFKVQNEIMHRDNYSLYRASKLYLAEHGMSLSKMEEAYMSRWAVKIPLVGRMVKGSERAYITYLNKLRADSFDAMKLSLGKNGQITIEQARIISNFINASSGRGTLPMMDAAAQHLNGVFFAPRFVASRFQMLLGEPLYFGIVSGKAPFAAKGALAARALVAQEYARILIGAGVVYGLGMAAGAEVETNSRSSDFGKLRFGNTRVDPMAGILQITVLLTKFGTGEKKNLRTGMITPLRAAPGVKVPYGGENLDDSLGKFVRFKLAPAPGLAWSYATGTDAIGQPFGASDLFTEGLVPMSLRDIYDSMLEQGMPAGAAFGVASVFGAGVQNFDVNQRRK